MKYKVGDKVRVKKWEDLELEYKVDEDGEIWYGVGFDEDMKEFCGKELVIRYVGDVGYLCHGNNHSWQDWMLEGVVEPQFKYRDKAVDKNGIRIIFPNGIIYEINTEQVYSNKKVFSMNVEQSLKAINLTVEYLKNRQIIESDKATKQGCQMKVNKQIRILAQLLEVKTQIVNKPEVKSTSFAGIQKAELRIIDKAIEIVRKEFNEID